MTASTKAPGEDLEALEEAWVAAWPAALAMWSKYTRLRPPRLCLSYDDATSEGLSGSFAMIRLVDQSVVINLAHVVETRLQDYALEILAHEIGHHILAPATLTDHARMVARMRWGLPTVEQYAPMVANLYTDLLINDRLHRESDLRLPEVFVALRPDNDMGALWSVYLRIYELLWSLSRGTLGLQEPQDQMEGDAWLGARLIRSYRRDWLDGSGRFATLMLRYLLEDTKGMQSMASWADTRAAANGGMPNGLTEMDPEERAGAIHPAEDPELSGLTDVEGRNVEAPPAPETSDQGLSRGQAREPFQYGEVLRATGIEIGDHEVAVRYYRERAQPHLVPFPRSTHEAGSDPLPEGLEPWDIGHALDDIDWLESVIASPTVIPGMTTVQRVWGTTEGTSRGHEPFDLDLYVDSSGSMANPQYNVSYPALAGAIICLSALRVGASVQATLWSGVTQVMSTPGFVHDTEAILRVLTGYYGAGTAFPLPTLRRTYELRRPDERPVHIMVISDDGVNTMFGHDEKGNSGWDLARHALATARGGGTFVLRIAENWESRANQRNAYRDIKRARDKLGWHVYPISSWDDLVGFARQFSRDAYDLSRRADKETEARL